MLNLTAMQARGFMGRRPKYGNRKTDGFDSALEARFYSQYLLPLSLAESFTIEKQRRYKLIVNGAQICDYVADFFIPERNIVFETKGMYTAEAKIKLRLMKALYETRIVVVRSMGKFEEVPAYRAKKPKSISDPRYLFSGNAE